MTIDEIRDLIDNTITTNGVKNITGQALNLALNEIVNAVAEAATTGGSGVKRLYANIDGSPITDEQQLASNAALYTEIVTALTSNELPPQVMILVNTDGTYINGNSLAIIYGGTTITLFIFAESFAICSLASDGNVTVQIGG